MNYIKIQKCNKEEIKQQDLKAKGKNYHIYEENGEQHQENIDIEKKDKSQNKK